MALPQDAVAPITRPATQGPFRRRRIVRLPRGGAQAATYQAQVTYTVRRVQNLLIVTASVGMTAPYWHWYVDGVWRGMNRTGIFTVVIADGAQANIQAVPVTDPNYDYIANAPTYFPATRTLWFNESTDDDASFYLAQWATGATTPADGDYATINGGKIWQQDGVWSYRIASQKLDDLTWYWFRVVPFDRAGNKGTAIVLGREYIVRKPDAPAFVSAFSAGSITVS